MNIPEQLGRETLHSMLNLLPVHVFCFDSDLICRYAAPIGTHFLGTRQEELFGRPVEGIFPESLALRPQLEQVFRTRQAWLAEHLPYLPGPEDDWDAGAWRLMAQPYPSACRPLTVQKNGRNVMTDARRTTAQAESDPAILVSCIEKPPADALAMNSNRVESIRRALSDTGAEHSRSAALIERVRTKLTVVRGFSQLLRRRQLRENPKADLHELDRIGDAVRELDELLYQFEYSAR